MSSIRLFLSKTHLQNFMVHKVNVKNAFLNGNLSEDIKFCHNPKDTSILHVLTTCLSSNERCKDLNKQPMGSTRLSRRRYDSVGCNLFAVTLPYSSVVPTVSMFRL